MCRISPSYLRYGLFYANPYRMWPTNGAQFTRYATHLDSRQIGNLTMSIGRMRAILAAGLQPLK
ncbi:hypothetical protein B5P44_08535 [Mycobacterium sp. CBMA 213]|nr:hypothetical protein [Mycolicibacterium sp. CBMA 213]